MSINSLNYLRQATACLLDDLPNLSGEFPEYAGKALQILSEAAQAKKFVLPKGGRIFDTELRALPDEIRLPFPQIVVEYEAGDATGAAEQVFGKSETHSVPKRIAYAQEADDGWIDIVVMCGSRDGNWTMLPYVASVQRYDGSFPRMAQPEITSKTNAKVVDSLVTVMHKLGEVADQIDRWELRARVDTMDEVNAVLSLVEALSCINVASEALPARKANKSAAKRGAIPFDEYHVLKIIPSAGAKSGDEHGAGRSPREHLRRGHIRRIADGRRVWVNSCVVSAGSAGTITSEYKIKSAGSAQC